MMFNMIMWSIIGVLTLIGLGIWIYCSSTGFEVVKYKFTNDKLLKDSYRLVLFSDYHDKCVGVSNDKLAETIKGFHPDGIFLAGDMLTSYSEPTYHYDNALDLLEKLSKVAPIYYGVGNHESKLRKLPDEEGEAFSDYSVKLSKLGIRMLQNEKVSIEDVGIDVYGLDMEGKYYRKLKTHHIDDNYLENIFGEKDSSKVSILLAHNPEHFRGYAAYEPDFVFSGHVHGGIIGIPFLGGLISPQLKLFPKYDKGMFKENKSIMILSKGLGTHTIPFRINNKAELIFIEIKRN